MGFLCSQGRIRMELIVGLLILIGTILEGTEGLTCYSYTGLEDQASKSRSEWRCSAEKNACRKSTGKHEGKTVLVQTCDTVNKECMEEKFGKAGLCVKLTNATELDTFNNHCNGLPTTTTTEQSPTNMTDGRSSKQRQYVEVDLDIMCFCYTDLCNPAGRSRPNPEVILGILVAVVLSTFNIGKGSF